MTYQNIIVETHGKAGLIRLNRLKQLNALNDALIDEVSMALSVFEADDNIGAVVLTGSDKAFAAGADIEAMRDWDYMTLYKNNYITRNWENISAARKPLIAAVAGYALGGGCELVMMCDIVIAAENAQFGQPEIKIGVVPGSGGTQRLPRAIGKSKAMELCLTGRMMDAHEAERCGLASRVVPVDKLVEDAIATAQKIASYSLPTIMMIKELINTSYQTPLSEGLLFERRTFHAAFATEDRREGMAAFIEKRKPIFKNR